MPALESLAAKINEILLRDKMPGRFASLLLLQIAPDSGVVRYVNAGHMPPLVVSHTGVTRPRKRKCRNRSGRRYTFRTERSVHSLAGRHWCSIRTGSQKRKTARGNRTAWSGWRPHADRCALCRLNSSARHWSPELRHSSPTAEGRMTSH